MELFEGQQGHGQLDEAGGIEVLARIEVVGVLSEMRDVLSVAVYLGVDELELVGAGVAENFG
jgi:hypothetical protein